MDDAATGGRELKLSEAEMAKTTDVWIVSATRDDDDPEAEFEILYISQDRSKADGFADSLRTKKSHHDCPACDCAPWTSISIDRYPIEEDLS